jgi:Sugar-binding cellulase-like
LITTECWGIVDFKDWPGLNWEIVKEMCALGVKEAAATGQWIAIASSNFVGPQFVGMWSDIDYHQKLTDIIKSSQIQSSLIEKGITKRLI